MADMMKFPDTVEEFMEQYKIVDSEEVYTNGTELVPIFRMKQWFEHLPSAETKWIPVSERLPEPNQYVLMTTAWGSVTIGERIYPSINNTVYFIHDGNTNAELDDVLAWMPLPEPYKEGEQE